jgi:hypothetical protein
VNKKTDFFEKRACSDLGDIPAEAAIWPVQSAEALSGALRPSSIDELMRGR